MAILNHAKEVNNIITQLRVDLSSLQRHGTIYSGNEPHTTFDSVEVSELVEAAQVKIAAIFNRPL